MPAIEVCSDANVAFQWFFAEGEPEAEVEAARDLVRLLVNDRIALYVLDLTRYEVGNALLRGRAKENADQTSVALDALAGTCPVVSPTATDVRHAIRLAAQYGLTLYDATYAAVARSRGAELATLDKALLRAGLGRRPSEIVEMVRLDAE